MPAHRSKVPLEQLPEIVERLRSGATLIAESRRLGYNHNGGLRSALRRFLGRDEYRALMRKRKRGETETSGAEN